MPALMTVGCLALAAVQFFAIISGLHALGVNWLMSGFIAIFITYIPFVGATAGVYGAVALWGWTLTQGLLLFFAPLTVIAVLELWSTMIENAHS